MNDVETLERDLRARFPRVMVRVDAPADVAGIWYVDVRRDQQSFTIQWRPDLGFGFSKTPGAYGEGADEIYTTVTQVENRIAELLDVPAAAAR